MTEPQTEQPPAGPAGVGRSYDQVLADAVRVLTEAARLTWPGADDQGRSTARPVDWAEFVTRALAGAAANVGGIEAVLTGRPGSWEADYVRNLLSSTVGEDEHALLQHRTEPLVVEVYVDELMVDLGVWKTYDDAQTELSRRSTEVAPSAPSPEQARALPPLSDEQEQQLDQIGALEERLEAQRQQDWAQYGQALKAHIETAARALPGLAVPVEVRLDLDSFRADGTDRSQGIEGQLLQAAILATPLPGTSQPPQDDAASPRGVPSPLDRLADSTPPQQPDPGASTLDQEQP